jgi:hypothetical protein
VSAPEVTRSLTTEVESRSGGQRTVLLTALCALPLLLVFGILWKEATALPLADDYQALLVFGLDQQHLSAGEKLLHVVTAQYNEYKLVLEHAVEAEDLVLTGHLNILFMVWLGNLLLIPLGFIYWLQFRPDDPLDRRLLWFLPLCWFLDWRASRARLRLCL